MPKEHRQPHPDSPLTFMTVREYIATEAMIGLTMRAVAWENVSDVAQKAVQIADALIIELNKTRE